MGETVTQRGTPQVIGIRLVGLTARDTAALAEFYRDAFGLLVLPTDAAALGSRPRPAARNRDVGDHGGTTVARVGLIDECR
jgi:hypothetical protein